MGILLVNPKPVYSNIIFIYVYDAGRCPSPPTAVWTSDAGRVHNVPTRKRRTHVHSDKENISSHACVSLLVKRYGTVSRSRRATTLGSRADVENLRTTSRPRAMTRGPLAGAHASAAGTPPPL